MKKIITILLTLTSFCSYAQDFSTILFIGRGLPIYSYAISINQRPIGTVNGLQALEYKIYTEGAITVEVVWNGKKHAEAMVIKHGKTYYFECYGIDDREVGKGKANAILKENQSIIKSEEQKDNLLSKMPPAENGSLKQGTCFVISRKGFLITSYHIVKSAKTVRVKGIGGDFSTLYGADVVAYDVDLDMALLKIKNPAISFDSIPYRLSLETMEKGTKSFVLGYPFSPDMEDTLRLTEGVISSKSGVSGSISEFEFSQALQPGYSGCPLFNDKGDVIGLINTSLNEAKGTSYAIKSPYIQAFLMSIDNTPLDISLTTTTNLTLQDKIASLKNCVFVVKTE